MVTVIALRGFEHGKAVRRGDLLTLSVAAARQLQRQGLVAFQEGEPGPRRAAGLVPPSSALPAAPVSRKTTSSSSGAGAKRRTGKVPAPSSS